MKYIQKISFLVVVISCLIGCQKMKRPALGDFPRDTNPPGGPLKFYVAFDGTTDNPLLNAVDSIRASFPSNNPLTSIAGISGNGVQGATDQVINYPSANDFKGATSCTISFWLNNTVNSRTEFCFSLVDKDYWHESSAFLLLEHAKADACTFKFALMDHWVEYTNQSFTKPVFDGQWHHLAFTYDENTSDLKIYFDGENVPTPGTSGHFMNGDSPMGALDLTNGSNFLIGGWNKHAGLSGPGDAWINSFSGKIDQFRLYGVALSASDVMAIYNSRM